ncbi:hypothetical protein B296_00004293, partial [Ensete ventricosum]
EFLSIGIRATILDVPAVIPQSISAATSPPISCSLVAIYTVVVAHAIIVVVVAPAILLQFLTIFAVAIIAQKKKKEKKRKRLKPTATPHPAQARKDYCRPYLSVSPLLPIVQPRRQPCSSIAPIVAYLAPRLLPLGHNNHSHSHCWSLPMPTSLPPLPLLQASSAVVVALCLSSPTPPSRSICRRQHHPTVTNHLYRQCKDRNKGISRCLAPKATVVTYATATIFLFPFSHSKHCCMHDATNLYRNDLSLSSLSQHCSFVTIVLFLS